MQINSDIIKVRHGFFTSDEDRVSVQKHLRAKKLVTLKQIHSPIVVYADSDTPENSQIEGDALVTDISGLAIGIVTADCGPLLFSDEKAKIVGVAHAGWRGARYGVIEATLDLMKKKGAGDISVALGPCIQRKSYEVSDEFIKVFLAESISNEKFFFNGIRAGHLMFDLPAYIREKLRGNGVKYMDISTEDTLSQPDKFCSYRRTTLAGGKDIGRQFSAICI